MKKLLYLLLILPSLAWGQEYARMNPYILGAAAAGATCSVNTNFIGDNDGANSAYVDLNAGGVYCNRWQPDCSGKVYTAKLHNHYQLANAKVYLYSSSDTVPAAADALLDYSAAITANDDTWVTGAMTNNVSVSTSNYYWVCVTYASGTNYIHKQDGLTAYEMQISDCYNDPPDNLKVRDYQTGNSQMQMFITIGD